MKEKNVASAVFKSRTGAIIDEMLGGTRMIVTRNGRICAALVPVEDLEALREMDRIAAARAPRSAARAR